MMEVCGWKRIETSKLENYVKERLCSHVVDIYGKHTY